MIGYDSVFTWDDGHECILPTPPFREAGKTTCTECNRNFHSSNNGGITSAEWFFVAGGSGGYKLPDRFIPSGRWFAYKFIHDDSISGFDMPGHSCKFLVAAGDTASRECHCGRTYGWNLVPGDTPYSAMTLRLAWRDSLGDYKYADKFYELEASQRKYYLANYQVTDIPFGDVVRTASTVFDEIGNFSDITG